MKLQASTLILLACLAGCMTPDEIEQANTRLEVSVCAGRSSAKYDECVAACNNGNSASSAQTTCETGADDGLMGYLRGLSPALQQGLALAQEGQGIPEGLSREVRDKFRAWRTERTRCADQGSVEDAREACIGGAGFLWSFPHGCERARRDTYNECIGECPAEQAKGTICQPVSARIPSWAQCGTWQADGTGACGCASDELSNRDSSFCFEFRQAMDDPRYGADCNGNAQDDVRFAPYVLRNELDLPTGVEFKCVPWSDGVPNFRGEAAAVEVGPPGGVLDPNSCPANLDEPGRCDEVEGRCAVGTDADDCAVDGLQDDLPVDDEPAPDPTPQSAGPASDGDACACGLTVASGERDGACGCAGTWRVVHVSDWNAEVSQVCRNGRWLTFNWAPRDAQACCGGSFDGCCQRSDPAIGCN